VSEHEPLTKDCVCWICETTVPIANIQRHLHGHSEEEHTRAVRKMQREQVAIAAARPPDPEPVQGDFSKKKDIEDVQAIDVTG
jgi:hypothetical protein